MHHDDELKRTLQFGIHGTPELKREEKQRYLGEFRERVVAAIRYDQAGSMEILKQVERLLQQSRVSIVKIHVNLAYETAKKYQDLARRFGKHHTLISGPEYEQEYAVILASDTAVEKEDIHIKTRHDRLRDKGVPEAIIEAAGKDLCDACRAELKEKAPEELRRYGVLNRWDRFLRKTCAACGSQEG